MIMNRYVVGISATQRLKGLTIPVIVVAKSDGNGAMYSKKCADPEIVLAIAEWFKIQGASTSEFEKFFNMEIHTNDNNEAEYIQIWENDNEYIQYYEKDMYTLLTLLFKGDLIV